MTKINIICAALDSPNYKGDIIEDFEPDNQALASILKNRIDYDALYDYDSLMMSTARLTARSSCLMAPLVNILI